jgi:undecaprenyl-diphosphatase
MSQVSRENPFYQALEWLGLHERGVLIAAFLASLAAWGFVELADEVVEGSTMRIDERLLLAMRTENDPGDPLGPAWFEESMRDVTSLGSFAILAFLTFAVAGYLFFDRKSHLALYVLLAVGSGVLLSSAMKLGFDRPRPDLVPHGTEVYTHSFPSGHSFMSALVYLTLGALLAGAQESYRLKAYSIGLALLLALSVGLSRIYLGVHWPSDVLGGWAAGAAWATLCWLLAQRLRAAGTVE